MHRIILPLLALTFGVTSAAFSQPIKATPKAAGLGLQNDDRVIFIGDSITHQCLYTQYVEDFFYTRYPKLRIHFRNAGVSGDRAVDALNRFDDDIASFKPTVATILLGMNDGAYQDFSPEIFKAYERDMTALLDRLDALKVRVFLMSPTMFDHQAFEQMVAKDPERGKNKNPANYNAVLAYFGKWGQEVARKRGYGFIDMYGPLNKLTTEGRTKDPNFTLVADAIHPGGDGQFVMAYSMIEAFGEPGGAWNLMATPAGGTWKVTTSAGSTTTVTGGEAGKSLTLTLQPKCLPWAVLEEAKIGATLTAAGHRKSVEVLTINGLLPGRYDVLEDSQIVGTWDHITLGKKIELQADPESVTLHQAQQVIALNKKRNDEAIRPLRDLYGKRKGMLRGDKAAFETWWNGEGKAREAELMKKAEAIEDEIYKINQPAEVKLEVRPSTSPAPVKAKPTAKKKAA
ncbi:MAG: SGNH/GDSL hydrolase family protein [Prosthecobacter sp.]